MNRKTRRSKKYKKMIKLQRQVDYLTDAADANPRLWVELHDAQSQLVQSKIDLGLI